MSLELFQPMRNLHNHATSLTRLDQSYNVMRLLLVQGVQSAGPTAADANCLKFAVAAPQGECPEQSDRTWSCCQHTILIQTVACNALDKLVNPEDDQP